MSELLDTIEIETGPNPRAAVIWLHGLGADGNDFVPMVEELDLPDIPIRFIFPNAPMQPVTINGGAVMRSWYDILSADLTRREDEAGVRASQARVEALIARERERGIEPGSVVLAGFSQGGAIALQTGLRQRESVAGIMALSTYAPIAASLAAEITAAGRSSPIFYAHGTADPMISISRAESSRDLLHQLGCMIEWHEYPMPHSVCREEVEAIGDWLGRVLKG